MMTDSQFDIEVVDGAAASHPVGRSPSKKLVDLATTYPQRFNQLFGLKCFDRIRKYAIRGDVAKTGRYRSTKRYFSVAH